MKYNLLLSLKITLAILCMSNCKDKSYYEYIVEDVNTIKDSFSIIGLLREDPKDTIEISYSNATDQKGINEVLTSKFATDTLVGMNDTWVKVEIGKQFGGYQIRYLSGYTRNEGLYFKICNRGKKTLFYFRVSNPKIIENEYLSNYGLNSIKSIITKTHKPIYDILYPSGVYKKEGIKQVADLFKLNDKVNDVLFTVKWGEPIDEWDNFPQELINYNSFTQESLYPDRGRYSGYLYPGECLYSSSNYSL